MRIFLFGESFSLFHGPFMVGSIWFTECYLLGFAIVSAERNYYFETNSLSKRCPKLDCNLKCPFDNQVQSYIQNQL